MKNLAILLMFILSSAMLFAQETSLSANQEIIASLRSKVNLTSFDYPIFVMSFNRDTVVLAGYFSDRTIAEKDDRKNSVYRTTDCGKSWEAAHFKGDAMIYDVQYEKNGMIWMGGSDEFIHYSNDYGATWTRKPKPFRPVNRVLSIYMIDSVNGIAGGLSNGLAITKDNWSTAKQIPSPLDQGKFKILKSSARNRIDRVEILDSIIMINQDSHIYFSKLSPVSWQAFNIPVLDFFLDKEKKEWHVHSLGNKMYVLSSKLELIRIDYINEGLLKNKRTIDQNISFAGFFNSEIRSVTIKAVEWDFREMSGGCMRYPLYDENVQYAEYILTDSIFTFSSEKYKKSNSQNFYFSKRSLISLFAKQKNNSSPQANKIVLNDLDFRDYEHYLESEKKQQREQASWGGDVSSHLDLGHPYFSGIHSTIDHPDQRMLDSLFASYPPPILYFARNEPYLNLYIVNSNSDTLTISSENAVLFSLPWTIKYKGDSIITYDPEITFFIRSILPEDFNYHEKLSGGELIYKLVEERIIDEQEYKNGY
jgi:hypothetical protein